MPAELRAPASRRILLVFPSLGFAAEHVRHLPLSLLYAAAASHEAGYRITILDHRLSPYQWARRLQRELADPPLLVGISVMSGYPIHNALAVSRLVKRCSPHTPVVWGGACATTLAPVILREPSIDFVVRGYGSRALRELADTLSCLDPDFSRVTGLAWRDRSGYRENPCHPGFEPVAGDKIPYELLAASLAEYRTLGHTAVFPLYSSYGCAHNCSFCISPFLYRHFQPRWQSCPVSDVIAHLTLLYQNFGARHFYLYDDDPFAQPAHAQELLTAIHRNFPDITIGFRSLRVDEVLALPGELLKLLASVSRSVLHIGAEHGSDRMLRLMNKGISVADIHAANRRLAGFPELTVGYNLLLGAPGETIADLQLTIPFLRQIARDNPQAFFFYPNTYIPTPGTAMFDAACAAGFAPPADISGWADFDIASSFTLPWWTPESITHIRLLQVFSLFCANMSPILRRYNRLTAAGYGLLRTALLPLLEFRIRHHAYRALLEYRLIHTLRGSWHTRMTSWLRALTAWCQQP